MSDSNLLLILRGDQNACNATSSHKFLLRPSPLLVRRGYLYVSLNSCGGCFGNTFVYRSATLSSRFAVPRNVLIDIMYCTVLLGLMDLHTCTTVRRLVLIVLLVGRAVLISATQRAMLLTVGCILQAHSQAEQSQRDDTPALYSASRG